MILGITGTDGAGKGTVVEYLVEKKGFAHFSARTLFAEKLRERGLPATRENLRLVGNELRRAHGNDYIVAEYLRRAEEAGLSDCIIESIRATAEAKTLKQHGGLLLAVDADQHLRYERITQRQSASDQVSFKAFIEHEAIEMNDPDPNGMQKAEVMEMADFVVTNNDTVAHLYEQIEAVLNT